MEHFAVTSVITLILPLPPSTNSLWIQAGRKRVISPDYRAWRLIAGSKLEQQLASEVARARPMVGPPLGVDIALPLKMRGDIDNRVKPILDLLVHHDVMADDQHVHALSVARKVVHKSCAVVTVRTVEVVKP